VPGSWSGGDPAGDDDADEGELPPPVHPDDRLWRHPSEVAWSDPSATPAPATPNPARPSRTWPLALTSALAGAVLALGTVALVGGVGSESADTTADATTDATLLRDPGTFSPMGLATVAESVLPSVVHIEVDGPDGARTGTGVVMFDDGHVLTNAHVVADATTVTLVNADGTALPGRVIGVDRVTDVAVVAPAEGHAADVVWTPATLGSTDGLEVGQVVVAVGAAAGEDAVPSVAFGLVAALGRRVVTAEGDPLHGMIEIDAPVAPTATGGALCDEAGAVIGLSTARADVAGAGYATPIEAAWSVAEALIADGAVHHVWLGIEGSDNSGAGGGVLVERVIADSPAEASGLESGDVLVDIAGRPIGTMSDLVVALRAHQPGEIVALAVERGDDLVDVDVTLAERSAG
jgi:putative serine protease PepD